MNCSRFVPAVALACLLLSFAASADDAAPLQSWADLLDQAAANPALEKAREVIVANAREAAALPIYRRAQTLADVGQHRTWLDGRAEALEPEIKEKFALAMSDFAACSGLASELPLLAAGYRLSKDKKMLSRIVEQLNEVATWSPLQRPGWTLFSPGNRLQEEGKDGNWLATGCGVRAIGDTVDILPAGSLSKELVAKLGALLEVEVAGVVDDWRTRRSWFIRADDPATNQWVLPTEGLVRACLILGKDSHHDAYELGAANLLRALDVHGANGEFEEGFGYASFTATSLLNTAHAMAVLGDRRAIDHPWLKHFPTWLVHHFQPGNMVINCFDAGPAFGGASRTRPLLTLAALCTNDTVARWALAHQLEGPSDDLPGLAVRALPAVAEDAAPPLFAAYEHAARVNWRDSWDAKASGVWVRGGHPLDQHDHQDRGHVNFISKGRPILIEAGTPSYSHKLMMTHYSSGVGHNVLQLGTVPPEEGGAAGRNVEHPGWQKVHALAPITVAKLDAQGGDVTVDGKACHDGLVCWDRQVAWTAAELNVVDQVELAEGNTQVLLFRWHLGANEDVRIDGDEAERSITWTDAVLRVSADSPVTVEQVRLPDNTLEGHNGNEDPGNVHTCLMVQTTAPVTRLRITTRVTPN